MTTADQWRQEFVERDGDRLAVEIHPEPDGVDRAPVVVICPAMGVPARYYRPFASALRAAGLAVVVADLRGTGASTPRPGRASRYGYPELVADVGAVLEAVKAHLDGRPCLLLGHSLGGQTALLHLALGGQDTVDGLVLVAVGRPHWRLYPGLRGLLVLPYTQAIAATATLLGWWPGWGFGGVQARGVIRHWAYTARTGRFPRIDGVDAEAALAQVRTPVLAVSVDGDDLTPPAVLDQLCAHLPAAPIRREHYTAAEAGAPLDHFRWVRASEALVGKIADFAADLPHVDLHRADPPAERGSPR